MVLYVDYRNFIREVKCLSLNTKCNLFVVVSIYVAFAFKVVQIRENIAIYKSNSHMIKEIESFPLF